MKWLRKLLGWRRGGIAPCTRLNCECNGTAGTCYALNPYGIHNRRCTRVEDHRGVHQDGMGEEW